MRLPLACLVLFVGLASAPDDSAKVARSAAQEAFDTLQHEQRESNERIKPGLSVNSLEWQNYCKEFIGKYLAHAKKYPEDSSAVGALLEIVSLSTGVDANLKKETLAQLRRDYLKTPLVVPSLRNLGLGQSQLDHDLLREIGDTNESKRVRALAWRAIINGRSSYMRKWDRFVGTEEARKKQDPRLLAQMDAEIARWKKDIAEAKAKLASPDLLNILADVSVGAKAPATAAVDLAGKKVSLADCKGKVVVLDFWSTTCGPCVRMIPSTNTLVREMKGRPFAAICVSADEGKEVVVTFRQKKEMLAEQWWAGYNSMPLEIWDVEGLPTTYVIDHEGVIRHRQVGYDAKTDKLPDLVRELVKKAEAGGER